MTQSPHPLESLNPDDKEFVLQLVLASGSLKELAMHYGVSYPTIRTRLDKLIERVEALAAGRPKDPMLELLADCVERGEITPSAARRIRDLHVESGKTRQKTKRPDKKKN